jgi:hypothetical protein
MGQVPTIVKSLSIPYFGALTAVVSGTNDWIIFRKRKDRRALPGGPFDI